MKLNELLHRIADNSWQVGDRIAFLGEGEEIDTVKVYNDSGCEIACYIEHNGEFDE